MPSIRSILARLTGPRLLLGPVVVFGQSVVRRTPKGDQPAPTSWSKISANNETSELKELLTARAKSGHLRLVAIGEQHHQPSVLRLQLQAIEHFSDLHPGETVLVVEYFNLAQNQMLEDFMLKKIDLEELAKIYDTASEGFDMQHLTPILMLAQEKSIAVFAGFPPRGWARELLQDREAVLARLKTQYGYDRESDLKALNWGHEAHFESLLSGQPPHQEAPADGRRGQHIFAAQVLKDSVMAWVIDQQLRQGKRVIAIAGTGHVEYSFGVMERVREAKKDEMLLLLTKTRTGSALWMSQEKSPGNAQEEVYSRHIADAVYLYDPIEEAGDE